MICLGCDLGASTAKAVILRDGQIIAEKIIPYRTLPKEAAIRVLATALDQACLSEDQIDYCLSTGFGKKAVPFANQTVHEVACLARAVRKLNPKVKTVLDVGGQVIRAFNIGEDGRVTDSIANDKCAASTGKFMEVMSHALELPIEQLSQVSLNSKNPVSITNQCGVFAESEVITYVNQGKDRLDIFAGISLSVAGKVSGLVRRINMEEELAFVGGVSKNQIVVRDVKNELGLKIAKLEVDPQLIGAFGAALLAEERFTKKKVRFAI